MSRPVRVTTTGTAVSAPIPMDVNRPFFNVGLVADVTGTVVYTVEYTADDVWSSTFNPATAAWFTVGAGMTGASTDQALNFTIPCTAIRLNQASGAGAVALTLIQQGI